MTPGADLYKLVDEQGDGLLIPWVKYAKKTGDYGILEEYFDTMVKEFLYNEGKGRLVPVSELVMIRNKQRNAMLSALRRKKGRGKSGPNILLDLDQDADHGDVKKALKILDGCIRGNRSIRYRELVWDVAKRGKMGENLLHICLLHNTVDHNDLAKLLVKRYPKMVNDIFISEEYYGLSPLHQAIVNEDIAMVYFMCRNSADVHQRCYGSFFCAEDQKSSRTDSLEHEWVDLVHNTRYSGQMYWGEHPLSFAACTNQLDCFRILRACKADPNRQDTNGNTVLHMAVIHELPEMFRLAHESGAKLHIKNCQKLTAMGVAAKLAKKEMFDLILELEQDIIWTYGDATCTAFPLQGIDTIDQITGHLNHTSALSLVVYGKKSTHLDFFDGLLEDLLEEKWKAFARNRLVWSMTSYLVYLLSFYVSFMTRSCYSERQIRNIWVPSNSTHSSLLPHFFAGKFSYRPVTFDYDLIGDRCHLWDYKDRPGEYSQRMRLAGEFITLLFALVQAAHELVDIGHSGRKRWWKVTRSFPAKMLHKFSFTLVLAMFPLRFSCALDERLVVLENTCAIVAVLATTFHLFFYCRGMRFVGPFVLMVYKIIIGDMLRFLLIYLIFLISFSQSCFVVFKSCEREHLELLRTRGARSNFENIMSTPVEAAMRMFLMSVGEFGAFYKNVHDCPSRLMSVLAKVIFLVYELLVTVLLLNLLIAMMTRTYEKISETQKEWKRQWAQVILMLEQSLKPHDRLVAMLNYSRPIRADKTRRAFVVRQRVPGRRQKQSVPREAAEKKAPKVEARTKREKFSESRLRTVHSLRVRRASNYSSDQGSDCRG
ncbi:hypothetical protein QR680_012460 [Steinernema hermaphroditum]|uniref:Ion transport domain-containing protein n=1 Tax=Steinernema hermaphroditum TaxID=289476 RepID=A0AA39I235_9BILA|nr:hypothetical protein QR680_012460 [Steinernema hermaphroditum]